MTPLESLNTLPSSPPPATFLNNVRLWNANSEQLLEIFRTGPGPLPPSRQSPQELADALSESSFQLRSYSKSRIIENGQAIQKALLHGQLQEIDFEAKYGALSVMEREDLVLGALKVQLEEQGGLINYGVVALARLSCPEITLQSLTAGKGEALFKIIRHFELEAGATEYKYLRNSELERWRGWVVDESFPRSRGDRAAQEVQLLLRHEFLLSLLCSRCGQYARVAAWEENWRAKATPGIYDSPAAKAAANEECTFCRATLLDLRATVTETKLLYYGGCLKLGRKMSSCSSGCQLKHWKAQKGTCSKPLSTSALTPVFGTTTPVSQQLSPTPHAVPTFLSAVLAFSHSSDCIWTTIYPSGLPMGLTNVDTPHTCKAKAARDLAVASRRPRDVGWFFVRLCSAGVEFAGAENSLLEQFSKAFEISEAMLVEALPPMEVLLKEDFEMAFETVFQLGGSYSTTPAGSQVFLPSPALARQCNAFSTHLNYSLIPFATSFTPVPLLPLESRASRTAETLALAFARAISRPQNYEPLIPLLDALSDFIKSPEVFENRMQEDTTSLRAMLDEAFAAGRVEKWDVAGLGSELSWEQRGMMVGVLEQIGREFGEDLVKKAFEMRGVR